MGRGRYDARMDPAQEPIEDGGEQARQIAPRAFALLERAVKGGRVTGAQVGAATAILNRAYGKPREVRTFDLHLLIQRFITENPLLADGGAAVIDAEFSPVLAAPD